MADQEYREPALTLECAQVIQDRSLHDYIESCCRLVEQRECRSQLAWPGSSSAVWLAEETYPYSAFWVIAVPES